VVNHPAVRPFAGLPDAGDLDFSPLVACPEHVALLGEHGGFLLIWSGPGIRELHVFLLPGGRGKWGFDAQAEVIAYAQDHEIRTLWARITPQMRHLALYARHGGMRPTGETIEAFGTAYRIFAMEVPTCLPQ
jgi:hypothetical protein